MSHVENVQVTPAESAALRAIAAEMVAKRQAEERRVAEERAKTSEARRVALQPRKKAIEEEIADLASVIIPEDTAAVERAVLALIAAARKSDATFARIEVLRSSEASAGLSFPVRAHVEATGFKRFSRSVTVDDFKRTTELFATIARAR